MLMQNVFEAADLVSTYSRQQAVEDGVLVDLTEWASADKGFFGGFNCPVAVTASVWAEIEAIPDRLQGIADVRGRAHDVLFMASLAARRGGSVTLFQVILPSKGTRKQNKVFKLLAGPGDDGELVITICQRNED